MLDSLKSAHVAHYTISFPEFKTDNYEIYIKTMLKFVFVDLISKLMNKTFLISEKNFVFNYLIIMSECVGVGGVKTKILCVCTL